MACIATRGGVMLHFNSTVTSISIYKSTLTKSLGYLKGMKMFSIFHLCMEFYLFGPVADRECATKIKFQFL